MLSIHQEAIESDATTYYDYETLSISNMIKCSYIKASTNASYEFRPPENFLR